jgi:hypothetical protein
MLTIPGNQMIFRANWKARQFALKKMIKFSSYLVDVAWMNAWAFEADWGQDVCSDERMNQLLGVVHGRLNLGS